MKFTHNMADIVPKSMTSRLAVRAIALAVGLLASGCASVQVDVDVYKGPFSHEQEIQVKQYTSLAMAARPVLTDLYIRIKAANDKLKHSPEASALPLAIAAADDGTPPCDLKTTIPFNERFLCELLYLYADEVIPSKEQSRVHWAYKPTDKPMAATTALYQKPAETSRAHQTPIDTPVGSRTTPGLLRLTENVTIAYSQRAADRRTAQADIDNAVYALNEALIYFAQKMLFTVNNQQLFDNPAPASLTDAEKEVFATQIAVLQSLGNTILVHANDLQRRKLHTAHQNSAASVQAKAIGDAFRLTPSAAFDAILHQLDPRNMARRVLPKPAVGDPADAGTGAPSAQRQQLELLKTQLAASRQSAAAYRADIAAMVAAHRTVVGEQTLLGGGAIADLADLQAALLDRQAITALYPAEPLRDQDKAQDGALKPLAEWLEREAAAGAGVAPQRRARLTQMSTYLTAENARLTHGAMRQAANRADILKALSAHITAQASIALLQTDAHNKEVARLDGQATQMTSTVLELETAYAARTTASALDATRGNERKRVIGVVAALRPEVIRSGEDAGVTGVDGMRGLLVLKLKALAAAADKGKHSSEDIALAHTAVSALPPEPGAPCSGPGCHNGTALEVLDNLIASLQAQRVRALAAGDPATAAHIVAALEAAHSQRTSMIYLRPASDYLRSVYSSSAFQDGTDRQYRNMLADWVKYYANPFEPEKKNVKEELEKLYWQNVNKVTVGGGGSTNYVLAKDDVGNWYVKAYSADPEMIFKSATSLALFSSGKKMNVNLLRRQELQRQLDANDSTLSGERRKEISAELKESNRQDGVPLLKVRDRYAARYLSDTAQQVSLLFETLTVMPDKIKTLTTADPPAGCTPDYVDTALPALDKSLLEQPRSKLATLMAGGEAGTAATAKTLTASEQAIQSGLTAIQLYAAKVHRTVSESKAAGCDPWQRTVAGSARKYALEQVLARATERKRGIERYEDALSSILDIAGEK